MPPDTTPSELAAIYHNRFDRAEDYRNRVWKTLIAGWFQSLIPMDSTVLDLGCGYGQFINNVACARKYAMDLNPVSAHKLNSEVTFLEQDCCAPWKLPDNSLDVVFTSNFFEHLLSKPDLASTVAQALRCLKKGGRLIAMGPNIRFVGGAYWDFFDHHLALTELSLQECFETAGFRVEYVLDRFLPYTMVNAPQYPVALLRLYLQFPLAWKRFGKQFVVIAAKP
jgi:SAM-dependent methyltransferase